jgi:hypothetical protein
MLRNLDLQRGALAATGCEPIFEDKTSRSAMNTRPFGVNRPTIYLSLGLVANAKTQREAAKADR